MHRHSRLWKQLITICTRLGQISINYPYTKYRVVIVYVMVTYVNYIMSIILVTCISIIHIIFYVPI